MPDPSNPDEVLATYTLQQDEGVRLGSTINVPFYSSSQLSAYNNATKRLNIFNQTDLSYVVFTGRIRHTLLAGVEAAAPPTDCSCFFDR